MRIELDSVTVGHRESAGTEWPVEYYLHQTGKREWAITAVCNGIADGRTTYRSLNAAREVMRELTP